MINWLLGLDHLNDTIQNHYLNCLKDFLIKEDLNYLEIFFGESHSLTGDLNQINQLFFWSKLIIWYQTKSITNELKRLIDELKRSKILLKKCLLIECEMESLNTNWSTELLRLNPNKIKLFKHLCEYFKELRNNCIEINENNEQFNEKFFGDNQISKLSIDTFDSLIDVDEFNYVKLKSLIQLIKLEISELLTLIIFYFSIDRSNLQSNLKSLSFSIYNLTNQIKQINQLIDEDCSFFIQFFMKSESNNQSKHSSINLKQNEILFNLKSAKTRICSSLLMVDNCLTTILDENSNRIDQFESEKIIDELTSAINALKLIPTTKSKSKTQFVHKEILKLNNSKQTVDQSQSINLDEEIPEYEVFEAYIDENDEIERFVEKYEDHLNDVNNAKYPDSLYDELKGILNVKAKDHLKRQAKALGIDEEEIVKQQESIMIKKSSDKYKDYNLIDPLPQMQFNFMKMTNESSKKIKFISEEENFGDDLSSDEN